MEKKICYLIAAHSDTEHLQKLITALDDRADFVIHIDEKVDIAPFKRLLPLDNVYWVENRIRVAWAGITQVDATLLMMRQALKKESYLKIVFISGSCYPIKSNKSIYSFFASDPRHEHIRYINMLESSDHYRNHLFKVWFKEPFYKGGNKNLVKADKAVRYFMNRLKLRNKKWNRQIIPYFGSNWWALTPACCQYILDYVDKNPYYREMNSKTFSPDEHFFHTLVGNSPFHSQSDGIQTFTGRGTYKLANLHIIHPSLAKWYSLSDLEEIMSSGKLFVRKVNTSKSRELVNKIDYLIKDGLL